MEAQYTRYDVAAWALAVMALAAILRLDLLGAFLAGLLVYQLVHVFADRLVQIGLDRKSTRLNSSHT